MSVKTVRSDAGVIQTSFVPSNATTHMCLSGVNPYNGWYTGGAASTGTWTTYDDATIVKMTVSGTNASGSDATIYCMVNGLASGAEVSFNSSTDYDEWTGEIEVEAGDEIYFQMYDAGDAISDMVVQVWMSGPAGGGLVFYESGGA